MSNINPDWYFPSLVGVVLTWAIVWVIKYTCYMFETAKPRPRILFVFSLLFGFFAGYWLHLLIVDAGLAHAVGTGLCTMILNQPVYMALMAFMRGKPKWDKVYFALALELRKVNKVDLDVTSGWTNPDEETRYTVVTRH